MALIFFINNVVICVEAFAPMGTRSPVVQCFTLIDFCTLLIVFVSIGTVLINLLGLYFE